MSGPLFHRNFAKTGECSEGHAVAEPVTLIVVPTGSADSPKFQILEIQFAAKNCFRPMQLTVTSATMASGSGRKLAA